MKHEVAFIRHRRFESYLWVNDVPGPAEVRYHRDSATRESLKNYSTTEITDRWKDQDVRRSQALKCFCVANPPAEDNILLDAQSLHQLLKIVSLRPIAEHRKAGQIASQKGRSRAQSKVT